MTLPKQLFAPIGLREVLLLMRKAPTHSNIRWLRRTIQRREAQIHEKVITQNEPRGPYRTTLALLQQWMPDWFPSVDVTELQEALFEMREEMSELRERDKMIQRRITDIYGRLPGGATRGHSGPLPQEK